MNRLLSLTLLFAMTLAPLAAADTFEADVNVKVKGMVCSFCAQGLDKKFRGHPAVEDVDVTIKAKEIRLQLKDGQTLTDEEIRTMVKDAGYNVDSIKR